MPARVAPSSPKPTCALSSFIWRCAIRLRSATTRFVSAYAGALWPPWRGWSLRIWSGVPMLLPTWSPSSPAVSDAAANTGSSTSRAPSRRISLASSCGTASPMPVPIASSNMCSAAW